jgi:uncharacterized protein with PhoU and TrkA domain
VLLVEGKREDILKIKDASGIDIKSDIKLSDPAIQAEDTALVEGVVHPGSRLIGRTLKNFQFRERYGVHVLGINRHGKSLRKKMSQVPLRLGDVLLVQGRKKSIATLEDNKPPHSGRWRRQPNVKKAPSRSLFWHLAWHVQILDFLALAAIMTQGAARFDEMRT